MTLEQFRNLPEDDRELMLAEQELVCQWCGNLRSVCSRDDVEWYPQRSVCHATAARELVMRQFHDAHMVDGPGGDRVSPQATAEEYHYTDGVSLWVSDIDLTPDDDFLGG